MSAVKIAIVDYSIGNIFSVVQACKSVGLDPVLTDDLKVVAAADGVILPGVGAFAKGMRNLEDRGLDIAIKEHVAKGKPFFGICLGMQLLCSESEEFEKTKGLGILPGQVTHFRRYVGPQAPVPQVMWNEVCPERSWDGTPLESTPSGAHFYFVHSYFCRFDQKVGLTRTDYFNHQYSSSVLKDNVFATQFHPEKSGQDGLLIYRKWKELYLDN